MFKNDFQGGPFFEILTAQGKDSANHWKTTGGVKKVYDKEVKSYVFTLEGTPTTTKMQIPKDTKLNMTLVQRYLVLQIYVSKGQDVSIEIGLTDLGNNKRRLVFSTAVKDIGITPLHAKIPLYVLKRAIWLNLAVDMVSMVSEAWKGQTFRAMESVSVSANCRIRKIFTMKVQPLDTTDDDALYDMVSTNSGELEAIPRQCQIAHDVQQANQVLNMTKLKQVEYRLKGGEPPSRATSASELDLNSSGRRSNDAFHIAFGSKVAAPPPATAARKLTSGREGSRTSRSSHSSGKNMEESSNVPSGQHQPDTLIVEHSTSRRQRLPSDPGTNIEDPETSIDKSTLGGSHTWSTPIDKNDDTPFKKPHPPREPSSDRARRKIRIKSGGKERTPHTSTSSDKQTISPLVSPRKDPVGLLSPRRDTGTGPDSVFATSEVTSSGEVRSSRSRKPNSHANNHQVHGSSQLEEENGDESISDVINTLRNKMDLNNDESKVTEYIQSDEEELKDDPNECGDVYIFKSRPTVAPRRNHSPNPADAESRLRKSQVNKGQRSNAKNELSLSRTRGAKPHTDFVQSESSDEEDLRKKILRNTPSPRPPSGLRSNDSSPGNSAGSQGLRRLRYKQQLEFGEGVVVTNSITSSSEHGINLKDSGVGPSLIVRNNIPVVKDSDSEPTLSVHHERLSYSSSEKSAGKSSSEKKSSEMLTHRNLSTLRRSTQDNDMLGASMNSTASRMSISKKSLREIPKTDARLSQTIKPYNSNKYQMEDLSESFEANMLASLKRQQENDEDDDAVHNDSGNHDDSGNHGNDLENHVYGDDPLSSSSDDTSYSTWHGPAPTMLAHHYQDEMHLPTSRLSNDTLNTSNPRDWGGVFSPPIVLPSDMAHTHDFTAHKIELKSPRKHSPDTKSRGRLPSQGDQGKGNDTDSEDELDLLYDPCLNCYFDPKTCKYYELV